jgi:hypothetical protein
MNYSVCGCPTQWKRIRKSNNDFQNRIIFL